MKSLFWSFLLIMAMVLPLQAAYLTDIPTVVTQPDGSSLNCLATGDEFYNWLHDSEGFTIIQNKQTGWYTYAIKSGGELESSSFIAGRVNPHDAGLQPYLNISEYEYKQKRHTWWQDAPRDIRTPTSGQINNLVIFIRFSDQTEFTGLLPTYDTMFNNSQPNTNSMHNYFLEDSYQNLSITTTFYPPSVGDVIVSYQDSQPRDYYTPYSATNTIGYSTDTERRLREHALLRDAVDFVAQFVPADLDIDADDDGNVDNICFIIRGTNGAWADLLWPHMWELYSYDVFINGAVVSTYNFQLEDHLLNSGVGVLCHEMSHSIGFPDLYHYTSNGISPVGRWDLMESNRNPPQHHCTYMKSRYTDWLPPMRTITQSGQYWVNKMLTQENNCFRIMSNSAQYSFVVEFRKTEGFFEPSLPGSGMLIFRIDSSEDGDGNADGPPDEVYVYRPNGTTTSNGSVNLAFYSVESGRTAINETSNPSAFLGDGQFGGLNLSQIGSSAGDSISFFVTLPSPPPTDYDEGFESGDFSAYPWSFSGNADWSINNAVPYEGSFCARSNPIGNNQNSAMVMTIDVPVDGNIGFFKKVSSESGYDYLKFYIDDIQKGQWAGNSNWSYVQFPIPAGNHALKWSYAKDQGVVAGEDCAWVDNISFRWEANYIHFPPMDFTASSLSDDIGVQLSWLPPIPSVSTLRGYRIFKDGIQIADLDTTNATYTDYSVIPEQAYSYFVKSFYSNPYGHSFSTDTLTVIVEGEPIIPIITSAVVVDTNSVQLEWMLPLPDRGVNGFFIYRNGALIFTVESDSIRQWTDEDLNWGEYSYQVASRYPAVASDPSEAVVVNVQEPSGINNPISAILVSGITTAYPNPFNEQTLIKYCIDKENSLTQICIYNLKGQKVWSLLQTMAKAGYHETAWNGINDKGEAVASGVYYCLMNSAGKVSVRKLLLIK